MTTKPLTGWTVAMTAERRAEEQRSMLEHRGATVVHAAVMHTLPLGPDAGLRAATDALVADPPDYLVATTGVGIRGWLASARTWGLGDAVTDALATTEVLARGPKAAAAAAAEGLAVTWRAPGETLHDVLDHLLTLPPARRVAIQLPGQAEAWLVDALRAHGSSVVELPVYEWTLPDDARPVLSLIDLAVAGEIDAITFTSAHAVRNLLHIAATHSDRFPDALANMTVACVGPVTAAAAEAAGAVDVVVASPARLGAMVRALTDHLVARAKPPRAG